MAELGAQQITFKQFFLVVQVVVILWSNQMCWNISSLTFNSSMITVELGKAAQETETSQYITDQYFQSLKGVFSKQSGKHKVPPVSCF